MNSCLINYQKPITKVPEKLIFLRDINTVMHPALFEFAILSRKNRELGGIMRCHKSDFKLREDYDGKSLAIDFIESYKKGEGYGKALINFAKQLSKRNGCNGYIFLKAYIFNPKNVPHIFYRKQGFTTLNKSLDKSLDKFIKKNKPATSKDFRSTLMFFPEPEIAQQESFSGLLSRFYEKIKNALF